MSLDKQILPLSFAGGIDSKTDPLQVPLGKLLVAENCTFASPGRLKKRNGYTQLGSTISNGQALMTYGNEAVAADKSTLYSYDSASTTWCSKGSFVSASATTTAVNRDVNGQDSPDAARHSSGLRMYAWESSASALVSYCIVDETTGALVQPPTATTRHGSPKVLVFGNYLAILVRDTGDNNIYVGQILYTSPTATLTFTSVGAGAVGACFDAQVLQTSAGPYLYFAFPTSAISLSIKALTTPGATTTISAALVTAAQAVCVAVVGDTTGYSQRPVFIWWDSTNIKANCIDYALTPTSAFTGSLAAATVYNVSGVPTSATVACQVFYTVSNASTWKNSLSTVALTTGGFGSASTVAKSVSQYAKPFVYNSVVYAQAVHYSSSGVQNTYFVIDSSGNVAAKIFYGVAAGSVFRILPESNVINSTKVVWAVGATDSLSSFNAGLYTQYGIESVTLDFADTTNIYGRIEVGQTLLASGGMVAAYDGLAPVEHGFHFFPDPVTVAAVGSGGSLTAGSYQVVVCYEWVDNLGQTHRSAPSIAQTVTAVNSDSLTVTIATLRVTAKKSPRTNVSLVVYRTISNGTTFYRDNDPTSVTANDTTADTVTYTCTITDAALAAKAQLYTTGGVVQNAAPNPTSAMFVHRNRAWTLDSTNPLQWWYSREILPPSVGSSTPPVEFSQTFIFNVDPVGGACTAGASLDEKAILFKSTSIFYVLGRGPDATGGQNDFTDAQPIATDAGCTNPRSVVRIPDGIMFAGKKGYCLLDRSLQVINIGAPIENVSGFSAATITSAQLLTDSKQVRITLSGGNTLVYDYFVGQWSVFTMSSLSDAVIFQNKYTYLSAAGKVAQESTAFSDLGSFISMRAQAPWIATAGIQGFQRVRELLILGAYASAHRLLVTVRFDYDQSAGSPMFVPLSAIQQRTAWDITATIPYQFRVPLQYQKCQSFQVEIQDISTGTIGESFSLSGLAMEVGLKKGLRKLPAAVTHGT